MMNEEATIIFPVRPAWERLFEFFDDDLAQISRFRRRGQFHRALPYAEKIMSHLHAEEPLLSDFEQHFRHEFKSGKRSTQAFNFFAMLHLLSNDWPKAAEAYKHSLKYDPGQPDVLYNLACIQQMRERMDEAIQYFSALIKINRRYAFAYTKLAQCYYQKAQTDKAIQTLERFLIFRPDDEAGLALLAACYRAQGEKKKAADICDRALKYMPENGQFFYFLSDVQKLGRKDDVVKQAIQHINDDEVALHDRIMHGFGLFNVFDRAEEYEKAFQYLAIANKRYANRLDYEPNHATRSFAAIKVSFSEPEHVITLYDEQNNSSPIPIFVLGMPRSGSSLIEQILTSHSEIHGAGEVSYLQQAAYTETTQLTGLPFPQCMERLRKHPEHVKALRDYYLSSLRSHHPDARFIVDKLPGNFMCIGFIRAVLPEAIILHSTREAMANCFSMYRHYFIESHPYAYDMEMLGHYFREYQAMMAHWHQCYPGKIHDIAYEHLVTDFMSQSKKMLEIIGLGWEDACQEFHQTNHPVRTASANQVKQPLYQKALEHWKHYRSHLKPLEEALLVKKT